MAKEKSESWVKGYAVAKMLGRTPYPVQIDADKSLDREEFEQGMRFGYTGIELPKLPHERGNG